MLLRLLVLLNGTVTHRQRYVMIIVPLRIMEYIHSLEKSTSHYFPGGVWVPLLLHRTVVAGEALQIERREGQKAYQSSSTAYFEQIIGHHRRICWEEGMKLTSTESAGVVWGLRFACEFDTWLITGFGLLPIFESKTSPNRKAFHILNSKHVSGHIVLSRVY